MHNSQKIWLVEGSWCYWDDEDHWIVAAYSTLEAAIQLRDHCQAWANHYCHEFWSEWTKRFGKPDEYGTVQTDTYNDAGDDLGRMLAEEWFGSNNKMRDLSPDPLVAMDHAGFPCKYCVVEVPLDPTEKIVSRRVEGEEP